MAHRALEIIITIDIPEDDTACNTRIENSIITSREWAGEVDTADTIGEDPVAIVDAHMNAPCTALNNDEVAWHT